MNKLEQIVRNIWSLFGDERFGLVLSGFIFNQAIYSFGQGDWVRFLIEAVIATVICTVECRCLGAKRRSRNSRLNLHLFHKVNFWRKKYEAEARK